MRYELVFLLLLSFNMIMSSPSLHKTHDAKSQHNKKHLPKTHDIESTRDHNSNTKSSSSKRESIRTLNAKWPSHPNPNHMPPRHPPHFAPHSIHPNPPHPNLPHPNPPHPNLLHPNLPHPNLPHPANQIHLINNMPSHPLVNHINRKVDHHVNGQINDAFRRSGKNSEPKPVNVDETKSVSSVQLKDLIKKHVKNKLLKQQLNDDPIDPIDDIKKERSEIMKEKSPEKDIRLSKISDDKTDHKSTLKHSENTRILSSSSSWDNTTITETTTTTTERYENRDLEEFEFAYNSTIGNIISQGCKFPTKPLAWMANLKANECGFHCDRDQECTHFSFNNGTCYFQSGSISQSDAQKLSDPNDEGFCGLAMVKEWNKDEKYGYWQNGCNFLESGGTRIEASADDDKIDCGKVCYDTYYEAISCTHFVKKNGRCILMSGEVKRSESSFIEFDKNIKCGVSKLYCDKQEKNGKEC